MTKKIHNLDLELDQGRPPDHIRKLKTVRNIKINVITNIYRSITLVHLQWTMLNITGNGMLQLGNIKDNW